MKLTILGCHAATPRTLKNPTAQVLEVKNEFFLIDCAEGTQVALRKSKVKFSKIKKIFISHLHGDHFFGLIGLISSFSLLNRKDELHVYGPKGIKEIILLQIKLTNSWTAYPLYFHELESKEQEVIFENENVQVKTIPLDHRIYTNGFLFKEKPGDRKLLINEVQQYNIDKVYYKSIVKGKDAVTEEGEVIPNEKLTAPPTPTPSYAYCSDTAFKPSITECFKNATVLYHESTFLQKHEKLAEQTKHSTAKQAAEIAKMANVEMLILGHYSTRYDNLNLFQGEAKEVFENTELADDGRQFEF